MINIQTIQHVSDCVPLYLPHSLYLKPVAKMNISVGLPSNKMGKSISNLDIMDKLSQAMKPHKFLVLKVSKSTVDFIRFEAELDERSHLRSAVNRIDGITLKISGFHDGFRVRASETKDEFPTRHDWDSYFRDAHNMDEMKPGERPDTIHITHLPIKWFCPRHMENEENVKPSESIFKRIFEKFGSVHHVDIPICDPYRSKMNNDINGMKTFSFEQDVLFEGYVQFDEYVGFVRAMDEFRGMKLVRKFVDKTQAVNITVNFDTSKHLSDAQIQRRERVRKRLLAKAKAEEEEIEKLKQLELEILERQRQKEEQTKLEELEKQREREEKRKEKHLKKIQEKGQIEISQKIRVEQRKLMIAQRKLESIRVLEMLFDRIKLKHMAKHPSISSRKHQLDLQRDKMRERLVEKYKIATEKLLNDQQKKVEDIKNKTPLMGLLSSRKAKHNSDDSDNNNDKTKNEKQTSASTEVATTAESMGPLNPFKNMAAMNASNYNSEAASEWMKSLSMFPYAPHMFHGLGMYRPPTFPVSVNYRGFAPRMRARGRGRGRGRGSYDGYSSSSHYNNHKYNSNYDDRDHRYDDEDGAGGGGEGSYHKYSRGRHHSRSRSRSRDRRSRSRSRSRTRSRSRRSRSRSRNRSRHYSKRSRSRSRTRSRSYSRSATRSPSRSRVKSRDDKTRKSSRSRSPASGGGGSSVQQRKPSEKTSKKLVSTRRSRSSSDWSNRDSRSRSRTRSRTKSSWSKRDSRERHSSPPRKVIIETDMLVRSAEEIKRTIEKNTQDRMREEEREIKQTFSRSHKQILAHNAAVADKLLADCVDSGRGTAEERSATELSKSNSNTRDKHEEYEYAADEHEDSNRKLHRERRNSSAELHHTSSRRNSDQEHRKTQRNSSSERSSQNAKRRSLDRRDTRTSRRNSAELRHSTSRHNSAERRYSSDRYGSNC